MKILFICTHNRCRSILAEAVFKSVGEGIIDARSAGSQPVGEVHPLTLEALATHRLSAEGLKSQSWDDFSDWSPDLVITVCDSAAGESCPVWFGKSTRLHWGLRDPSSIKGSHDDITTAFTQCIAELTRLANSVTDLLAQELGGDDLIAALKDIEVTDGRI